MKDAWEQLMFTTLEIKELDTINTPGYIQYAYVEIKKTFYDLIFPRLFFFRTLIPVILFTESLFRTAGN